MNSAGWCKFLARACKIIAALLLLASQAACTDLAEEPGQPGQSQELHATEQGITGLSPGLQKCADASQAPLQVPSPNWQEQVFYMLFIDRFSNGEPGNDDQGHGEYDPTQESHFNGGDIQGIIDRLDYLQQLGVTALWITPPVLNQWWSSPYQAAGWHGYWAVNFKEIDPHFGTLADYQRLSRELHCRGMYLIQDIVANHTANYFTYDNQYDPEDTARNFRLLEPDSQQRAPTQRPFNMVDRLNPDHAAASIYHWTPSVIDYDDPVQEKNYSLGHLADLNTENPVVIDALKHTYRYWMDIAGVDAFRIDTVMLVPHEFWRRFLHDPDGIYAHARKLGKDHFLTFGESVRVSQPMEDSGEQKVAGYLGSPAKPLLNSMLGYPLYFEIRRVLARGQAPATLAYRLAAGERNYPDPFVIPNFIDNHDTPRFLASGSRAAMRQALTLVFSIPGIPIIYQGTEQAFDETRIAMFKGGYRNHTGSFDQTSATYQLVSQLSSIRRSQPALTQGKLEVLAANDTSPGLLVIKRSLPGESIYAIFNTANHAIFASDLQLADLSKHQLEVLYADAANSPMPFEQLLAEGKLESELPARTLALIKVTGEGVESLDQTMAASGHDSQAGKGTEFTDRAVAASGQSVNDKKPGDGMGSSAQATGGTGRSAPSIVIDRHPGRGVNKPGVHTRNFTLLGTAAPHIHKLLLVLDGNLSKASLIDLSYRPNQDSRWATTVPVRNLGEQTRQLQVYAPEAGEITEPITFKTQVTRPTFTKTQHDGLGDARGASGRYILPQHGVSGEQRDLEAVALRYAGATLQLELTMADITDVWVPPNGFDNLALSIFFSFPGQPGQTALPLLDSDFPELTEDQPWQLAHVASGWASYTYRHEGSSPAKQGEKIGYAPAIETDKASRRILLTYNGEMLGVDDWAGAHIYLTTWDMTGEGVYVTLQEEPADWFFGGGLPGAPKILDDHLITITTEE